MSTLLSVQGLAKAYGPTTVLDHVDLTLGEGEFLTLLGPSGCGKTTLLRCIAGLADPDAGRIFRDGRDMTGLAPGERELGMVFQNYALFPAMTVLDNVLFGLKARRVPSAEAVSRAREALAMVSLAERPDAFPHELSGGQQQRVALARALVVRPRILLLDEPLSALDARIRRDLRSEIRRLTRSLGMSTILVTHDQEEAFAVSDRICLMHRGRIVQSGSPQELYADPRHEAVARFLGNFNVMETPDFAAWAWDDPRGTPTPRLPGTGAVAPEDLRIFPENGNPPVTGSFLSRGVVEDALPLGAIRRYHIRTATGVVVADELNATGTPWHTTGDVVCLRLDPAHIRSLHALEDA